MDICQAAVFVVLHFCSEPVKLEWFKSAREAKPPYPVFWHRHHKVGDFIPGCLSRVGVWLWFLPGSGSQRVKVR